VGSGVGGAVVSTEATGATVVVVGRFVVTFGAVVAAAPFGVEAELMGAIEVATSVVAEGAGPPCCTDVGVEPTESVDPVVTGVVLVGGATDERPWSPKSALTTNATTATTATAMMHTRVRRRRGSVDEAAMGPVAVRGRLRRPPGWRPYQLRAGGLPARRRPPGYRSPTTGVSDRPVAAGALRQLLIVVAASAVTYGIGRAFGTTIG
jgi:hypothetical protein